MTDTRTIEVYDDTKSTRRCSGPTCGATLTWYTVVKSGRPMCFTGDPVALTSRHDDDRRLILALPFDENHWATCSDAASFKRRHRQ